MIHSGSRAKLIDPEGDCGVCVAHQQSEDLFLFLHPRQNSSNVGTEQMSPWKNMFNKYVHHENMPM